MPAPTASAGAVGNTIGGKIATYEALAEFIGAKFEPLQRWISAGLEQDFWKNTNFELQLDRVVEELEADQKQLLQLKGVKRLFMTAMFKPKLDRKIDQILLIIKKKNFLSPADFSEFKERINEIRKAKDNFAIASAVDGNKGEDGGKGMAEIIEEMKQRARRDTAYGVLLKNFQLLLSLLILYKYYSWKKKEAKRQKIENNYSELLSKLEIKIRADDYEDKYLANTVVSNILKKFEIELDKSRRLDNYTNLIELWLEYGKQENGIPCIESNGDITIRKRPRTINL